ncbi:MAG: hypothetical protein ACOC86_04825, partial [Candidatus Bipolaricaulota bacterium]
LVLDRTGWFMIGTPVDIYWGEVQVKDSGGSYESIKNVDFTASGAPLANGIFEYDPSIPDYIATDQDDWDGETTAIYPWFGYWVNVPSDADTPVSLKFEAAGSSPTPPEPPEDSASLVNGVALSSMDNGGLTPPPVPLAGAGEGPLEVVAYQTTSDGGATVTFAVTGEEATDAQGMRVEVQNLEGKQVFSKETGSTRLTWDAQGIPNGAYVYVASVKTDGTYDQTNVSKLLILQ